MSRNRIIIRTGLIILYMASLLSFSSHQLLSSGKDPLAQGPINFTPNVATIEIIQTLQSTPMPTIAPPITKIEVIGEKLIAGTQWFPIYDQFSDATGIPIGAAKNNRSNTFGYANINGLEGYKLIWITEKWKKHFLIVKADDPLFVGHANIDDGFDDHMELLIEANNNTYKGLGAALGGIGTYALVQYLACGATAGATCVTGTITALAAGGAGAGKALYHLLFEYFPEERDLAAIFKDIDLQRP